MALGAGLRFLMLGTQRQNIRVHQVKHRLQNLLLKPDIYFIIIWSYLYNINPMHVLYSILGFKKAPKIGWFRKLYSSLIFTCVKIGSSVFIQFNVEVIIVHNLSHLHIMETNFLRSHILQC